MPPAGVRAGWPLQPFHEQHALRAGLDELRGSGFHVGLDIQARDSEPVYAIQSGRAHILQRRGVDERVRIGNYIYWHVVLRVHEGQWVPSYHKVVGIVIRYVRHLHLSEVRGAEYLNPLRPRGRALSPWSDGEPPVIARPAIRSDGSVTVAAFDPQSFLTRTGYVTPVLAPAALAYRLYRASGRPVGPLRWAFRGIARPPVRRCAGSLRGRAHTRLVFAASRSRSSASRTGATGWREVSRRPFRSARSARAATG